MPLLYTSELLSQKVTIYKKGGRRHETNSPLFLKTFRPETPIHPAGDGSAARHLSYFLIRGPFLLSSNPFLFPYVVVSFSSSPSSAAESSRRASIKKGGDREGGYGPICLSSLLPRAAKGRGREKTQKSRNSWHFVFLLPNVPTQIQYKNAIFCGLPKLYE